MKIYTKTGDAGETGLFGGARVFKDDPRVEVYGTVDELNAALGIAAAHCDSRQQALLLRLQADLFVVGAELAAAEGKTDKLKVSLIGEADIERLEQWIDAAESELAPLRTFVLPGGCPTAAYLHLARAICRRAEREFVRAQKTQALRAMLGIFLNRASDLLFVLARQANAFADVSDIPWAPRA